LPGSFLPDVTVTEPLGNIVPWDKKIFYLCCL